LKAETTIKKIGDRLGIIIPRSAIMNADLREGDLLNFYIEGKNIMITLDKNEVNALRPVAIHDRNDNIYSRILNKRQLVLAK
jgi:antitoxin component of MazEF toxin-antitoxin module